MIAFRSGIKGFTLVEMAVVLIIVGLLLGGLLLPLSAQVDQKNYSDTKRLLEDSKEALMGYALINGYLPCPDTTNDGLEDISAGGCLGNAQEGNLPWATLGLSPNDSWSQHLIYRVTTAFAQRAPLNTFTLSSSGSIRICNEAACNAPRLTDNAVAVIVSKGKNSGNCSTSPSPPACADERANDDVNNDFVSHTITATGSANGEYDDVVVWLSANILMNRMISAGKLP